MGRVVENHSTYIQGLLQRLKELSQVKGIKTITPGVISRTRGRSTVYLCRISSPIIGGYKLIVRKGNSVQEVFVITNLSKVLLTYEIKKIFENK